MQPFDFVRRETRKRHLSKDHVTSVCSASMLREENLELDDPEGRRIAAALVKRSCR